VSSAPGDKDHFACCTETGHVPDVGDHHYGEGCVGYDKNGTAGFAENFFSSQNPPFYFALTILICAFVFYG